MVLKLSQRTGQQIIGRALADWKAWEPHSKKGIVKYLYGPSAFCRELIYGTGLGFRREVFEQIDDSIVPLLDLFENDGRNRFFSGEIGNTLMIDYKSISDLLRRSGASTKLKEISKERVASKKATTTYDDMVFTWKGFPSKLRMNSMPFPLIDRMPLTEFRMPAYLWREIHRPRTRTLHLVLTLPSRYDFLIEDSNFKNEINVRYKHPSLGRLRADVVKSSFDEIRKGDITNSEIINQIYFTRNGEEASLLDIHQLGVQYRDELNSEKRMENIVKIMGYNSVEDYLNAFYG